MAELEFRPIDFAHADLCVRFREDSYIISFGNADRFLADGGPAAYLERIVRQHREMPGSCLHAWTEGRIVGQIELGTYRNDRAFGYVYLFYLIPECRGRALGVHLEREAEAFFRRNGLAAAYLSVAPSNIGAVRFYLKHGWRDTGPRPDALHVRLMRKDFAPLNGESTWNSA